MYRLRVTLDVIHDRNARADEAGSSQASGYALVWHADPAGSEDAHVTVRAGHGDGVTGHPDGHDDGAILHLAVHVEAQVWHRDAHAVVWRQA